MVQNLFLSAVQESGEIVEEIVETVAEHNVDDIYELLSGISGQLSSISGHLSDISKTGKSILQLLNDSYLDSIAALLLILVGFEIMRIVRGWVKGEQKIGNSR